MLSKFVDLLPKALRPYAKAAYPFAANLAYIGATLAATGDYDAADLRVNLVGLAGVLLTLALPNKAAPNG